MAEDDYIDGGACTDPDPMGSYRPVSTLEWVWSVDSDRKIKDVIKEFCLLSNDERNEFKRRLERYCCVGHKGGHDDDCMKATSACGT